MVLRDMPRLAFTYHFIRSARSARSRLDYHVKICVELHKAGEPLHPESVH